MTSQEEKERIMVDHPPLWRNALLLLMSEVSFLLVATLIWTNLEPIGLDSEGIYRISGRHAGVQKVCFDSRHD